MLFQISEQQIHSQYKTYENYRYNNGCDRKGLIVVCCLGLAEEGFSTACDGAGESLILTGLEENEHYERYSENYQYNTESQFHFSYLLLKRNMKSGCQSQMRPVLKVAYEVL